MERRLEPELMDEVAQASAYAQADFAEPHEQFVTLFAETFPAMPIYGPVLDLGCGTADVTLRFAKRFPGARLVGVDGAAAMLNLGKEAVVREGLADRVHLVHAVLPSQTLPDDDYVAVISNSLLHHLHNPEVLWRTLGKTAPAGAKIFIMDLMRPVSLAQAAHLVKLYADGEPDILRRDFYNSLLAAFTPEEVACQLKQAVLLDFDVRAVSDRHLVVSGVMPESG